MDGLAMLLTDLARVALHGAGAAGSDALALLPWWVWPVALSAGMARVVGHAASGTPARRRVGRRSRPRRTHRRRRSPRRS